MVSATVQLTDTGEAQVTEYETSSGKDAAEGSLYDQIQAKKQEKYDELRERKKHRRYFCRRRNFCANFGVLRITKNVRRQ